MIWAYIRFIFGLKNQIWLFNDGFLNFFTWKRSRLCRKWYISTQLDETVRLVYKFWGFKVKNNFLFFYPLIMTKIFEISFFPQNLKIYTPIERSRRAELKYIIFDIIWTFFHVKKFKKPSLKSQIWFLRPKINRM